MTGTDDTRDLGRSLSQLHMKIGGLQAGLDRITTAGPQSAADSSLEVLLDLVDAVDGALERRQTNRQVPADERRSWFGRRRSHPDIGDAEVGLWEGLAVASAAAHERLARDSIEPTSAAGALDPKLHRIVDSVGSGDSSATIDQPRIEKTLKRGWLRRTPSGVQVIRVAQVVARVGEDG